MRWFTHIGRDSMIYPTKLRVRFFAVGNVIAGLAGLLHHLQMPVDLRLLLPELLCLLLAAVLFVINKRRKPREALNMLVYGLIIWYCLFMSNVWLYAIDDFSRERLVMLLLAVGVYYLMAEWWHVLWAILPTTVVAYAASYAIGRQVVYPPMDDWLVLATAHLCWLGYAVTNRNKREARIRDAQSLVRHMQRSLQPGLQSLEGILPELRYALAQIDKLEGKQRLNEIALRLKNNVAQMQEYLDLQTVNARYISTEERLTRLQASAIAQEAIASYPYTSATFRQAVVLEVRQDFEFAGSHEQWLYVVRNLFDNALTAIFSNPQKPRAGDIVISVQRVAHWGIIRVRDRGMGLDEEHLPYVFDPFYAVGKYAGVGLGLSYCKMVVEGAGGRIDLHAVALKGCSVNIRIPPLPVQTQNTTPTPQNQEEASHAND